MSTCMREYPCVYETLYMILGSFDMPDAMGHLVCWVEFSSKE